MARGWNGFIVVDGKEYKGAWKMGLNIEVGKAYRTRSGKKATVDGSTGATIYEFSGRIDGKYQTWNSSGSWRGVGEHPLDLISEWQEPEPELKIEAGKFYKLRSGSKARVDAVDHCGKFPICGCMIPSMDRLAWSADGKRVGCDPLDIIGPWIDPPKPLEFWSNIHKYPDGNEFASGIFCSKEQASRYNKCGNFIRTSKFIEVLPQ